MPRATPRPPRSSPRRRPGHRGHHPGLGRRGRPPRSRRDPGRPRRLGAALRDQLRRFMRLNTEVVYDGLGGEAEPACISPTPGSTSSTGCSWTIAEDAQQRRLQGALQGQGAHAVWIGDVLIRKAAEGIETYESNQNLVLTDGCRADSVPNLEIETGEIEAPATPRPREGSTTSSCSTCSRAASPRTRRAASWCTGFRRHHPQDRRPGPRGAPARHGRGRRWRRTWGPTSSVVTA